MFPKIAETLGGQHWNEDLIAVQIYVDGPMDNTLLKDLSRLPRLSNLQVRGGEFSPAQVDRLASMKQLDWLLLSGTNLDEKSIRQLREQLPQTFVTHL